VSLAGPSALSRPTSLGEYAAAKTALEARIDSARSKEEELKLRADLRLLDFWFKEDTERTSRAGFAIGVVMLSTGSGVAVLAGLSLALSSAIRFRGAAPPVAEYLGAIGGGLTAAGIGIGLIAYGGQRVMKTDSRSSTTSLFAPSARLVVGPGTMGVGGTF
jgi:hypothetical protein